MKKNDSDCPNCHSILKYKNLRHMGLLLIFVIYPLIFVIVYLLFDTAPVIIIFLYVLSSIYLLFIKKVHYYRCNKCGYFKQSNIKL